MIAGRLIFAVAFACSVTTALADEFPAKPVRLVVNFPAGGPSDPIARALAQKATELWGQQTIVDFRGGAAGNIGADHVAKGIADGGAVPAALAVGATREVSQRAELARDPTCACAVASP